MIEKQPLNKGSRKCCCYLDGITGHDGRAQPRGEAELRTRVADLMLRAPGDHERGLDHRLYTEGNR